MLAPIRPMGDRPKVGIWVTIDRLLERGKWGLFAVRADDRRRRQYAQWLGALRRRQIDFRRRALADLPPPPHPIEPDVGFVVPSPSESWDLSAVVEQVRELAQNVPSMEERSGHDKPYLLDLRLDVLAAGSPLARLALNPEVIATAASHFGMVPVLAGVTLLRSPHVPGPLSGSQLFHSDWEDVTQLKLFIYCSDVSFGDGPLTALSARASADVKRVLNYHYGGPGFRRADKEVLPLVAPGEVRAFEGPAGTAVFLDTSACLHYGSRVPPGAGDRLVVQFQFLRPSAFDLFLRRTPLPTVGPSVHREAWAALVTGETT